MLVDTICYSISPRGALLLAVFDLRGGGSYASLAPYFRPSGPRSYAGTSHCFI